MNAPKVMDKVNVCACTCARLSWGSEDLQLSSDFEPPSLIAPPPPKAWLCAKGLVPASLGNNLRGCQLGREGKLRAANSLRYMTKCWDSSEG